MLPHVIKTFDVGSGVYVRALAVEPQKNTLWVGLLPACMYRYTGLGTRMRHDLSMLSGGALTCNPNYVFSIHVAPDQSVWAGTWGGGVSRLDGTRWKNFTTNDGLAGNIVYSIVQESNGVFWFGTNNGVSRYDGKSWHNYDQRTGMLENNSNSH